VIDATLIVIGFGLGFAVARWRGDLFPSHVCDFTSWDEYSHLYQRRRCVSCGWIDEEEIGE
jgi:hypothetical protein